MELNFKTELPPLYNDLNAEASKKGIYQSPIKSIEFKNLQNDVGSKSKFANKTNSFHIKVPDVLSSSSPIKPELNRLQRQDLALSGDISSLKSSVEKIYSDFLQARASADLCQIKLDLGICQKSGQRFREFNADISNISKRIDATESKFYKNELKIKEKLEKIKLSLEEKQSEIIKPDYTRIYKKIDRVSAFVQNTQISFILNYIKSNKGKSTNSVKLSNIDANSVFEFENKLKEYQSRIEKKIQDTQHQIEIVETKLSNYRSFLSFLSKQNVELKLNENRNSAANLENLLEARLSSIERMLNKLTESVNKSILDYNINVRGLLSIESLENVAMSEIKELTNDWELFHRNNYNVQNQVYDILDNFDDALYSSKGSFLDRIESAEKLVQYCIKRILMWKDEEQEKVALSVDDNSLIKRMKDLEGKVQIAENRIKQIDGQKYKNAAFKGYLKGQFRMPDPPPLSTAKDDIKPFYIEEQNILTYDQENYNGDNNLALYRDNSGSSLDYKFNPEDVELVIEEDEEDINDDDGRKEDDNDGRKEDMQVFPNGLSPKLYSMYRIKRRDKKYSNRCYIPHNRIKKGDTLRF